MFCLLLLSLALGSAAKVIKMRTFVLDGDNNEAINGNNFGGCNNNRKGDVVGAINGDNNGVIKNNNYGCNNGNNVRDKRAPTLVNGNCVYKDGIITENGKSGRKATQAQEDQVTKYRIAMEKYQNDFRSYYKDVAASRTPKTSEPTWPKVPCFCNPEYCGERK